MKAAVLEDIKKLVVKQVSDPCCGEGDVIVKVEACSVCGADIRTYNFGHRNIILPHILGHEIAGMIVEKGKNVNNFRIGDRVNIYPAIACNECDWCRRGMQVRCDNTIQIGDDTPGGFAEYIKIPAKAVNNGSLITIPEGLSYELAAVTEPLGCVLNGQELCNVKMGDVVLVIGAGPIGCMHVILAKARGARTVILADINQKRLELAEEIGADCYINSSETVLSDKMLEYTRGKKADVVIVACNSQKAIQDSLELLDWGGETINLCRIAQRRFNNTD
ncbi:alcohol dehydrogenase [Thermoanaerobacteraceae bacterium SP2]|nr:alcohol dehydrogenase [Thermoanaerobacteraceae bacterium SP2]